MIARADAVIDAWRNFADGDYVNRTPVRFAPPLAVAGVLPSQPRLRCAFPESSPLHTDLSDLRFHRGKPRPTPKVPTAEGPLRDERQ